MHATTAKTQLPSLSQSLAIVLLLIASPIFVAAASTGRAPAFVPPAAPAAQGSASPPRTTERAHRANAMDGGSDAGDGDGSEESNPHGGRPGIVVFSGGTAFNSASAELAQRGVGGRGGDEPASSAPDGLGSLAELLALVGAGASAASAGADDREDALRAALGGTKVWHVLPVTDDGGSTAEIVRVLGGPAVGDIRSRLLRLAPGTTREGRAVRRLLGHRLGGPPSPGGRGDDDDGGGATHEVVSRRAREEWLDLLDGGHDSYRPSNDSDDGQQYEHPLWKGVSAPYRSIIRAFLVHFHTQVLLTHNGARQSPAHPPFDFTGGSVGNFFFAGARTFFGSLPAAIFLFSKVAGIPSGSRVLPAVLSQDPDRLVLGAILRDGTRLRGQYRISHPWPKRAPASPQSAEQLVSSGSVGSLGRHRQVVKTSLDSEEALAALHPSPISTVHYLLPDPTWRRRSSPAQRPKTPGPLAPEQQWSDRHEISLEPNPDVLDALSNANCIVYGCGSLYTSVLPSLVLEGVGAAIARRPVPKVLLLNGWHDSETSWVEASGRRGGARTVKRMDATAFVGAVVDALHGGGAHADGPQGNDPTPLVTDYITHIFYPIGTEIDIDEQSLTDFCNDQHTQKRRAIEVRGIGSIPADTCAEGSRSGGLAHHCVFNSRALVDALLDLVNGR